MPALLTPSHDKEHQRLLEDNAERYLFLADAIPLIIWTARPDGGLDYYNKAWFDYTGLTLAQTRDWGWETVLHPDDLSTCLARWGHACATGENYEIEYRLKHGADGAYRWFLGRAMPRRDATGEIVQWVGTSTDINDQKLAHAGLKRGVAARTAELAKSHEALELQQARLRILFDLIPALIWFKDTKNGILLVNQRVADALGKPVADIEGRPAREFYPRQADQYYADDLEVIRTGQPKLAIIQQLPGIEGQDRWVQTDKVPYRDQDGKVAGIVVMARDITELKRTKESLSLLGSAVQQTTDSILITTAELDFPGPRIMFVNPAFTLMTGYSAAEVMGKSPRILQGPRTDRKVLDRLRYNLEHGEIFTGETVNYRKDGGAYEQEWQIFPIRDAGDTVTHYVALLRDVTVRRQSEQRLVASEIRYRRLFEAAKDGVVLLNVTTGIIEDVNPFLTQLLGFTKEQLLGKEIWELGCFRQLIANRAKFEELQQTEYVRYDNLPLEAADGRKIDVEFVSNVYDEGGTKVIQCNIRDISARRKSEADLREKTAFLEAQINSTIDGILVVDVGGKKIIQNQRCNVLWGIPPEVVAAQDDERQVRFLKNRTRHPEEFQERINHLYSHPDETTRDEVELVDGQVFDRYSSPVRGADGRNYGRIWTFRDITADKAAERALRGSEERFKFVARAVSDAVWDWDLVTDTIWWNVGFRSTFGYVEGDIEPGIVSWTGRIHPDDVTRVVEGIQTAIATGPETWSAEYRFRRKDGSYATVQDRGFIVRDAAGRGIRMVGGMRDLTEQKKLEAQYLRAQRMESIGTLAGGIAHDLNNVLTPILMSIELLKLDSANDAGRNKILETIHLSCQRGADLVCQVLSFARGVDGQRVTVRLRHLIDDLKVMIGETFPRNIRIVTRVADDLWPITGDPTQLHQVLLNLAVNARDAMPEGGTLTLAARNVTHDAQYAGTSPEAKAGAYVLLQVTDSGCGIPPELRERIFEPFFTTKDLGQGTGLGLATVHAIVKSHGGFVTVESEVGVGTTFRIHLPAVPALSTTEAPRPPGMELPHGQGELILVVDDEQSIRAITQETLEAFGYRVITAKDGSEAIALFAARSAEITLVLTDMMMPNMDGATAIQVMVRMRPGIRIIAVSGLAATEYLTKATSAGVRHFLTKPYSAQTLVQLIHEVLSEPVTGDKKTPPTSVARR